MKFEKPVVFPEDLPEIAALFGIENPLEVRYLGGVPNVTYAVSDASARTIAVRVCNNGYTTVAHLDAEVAVLEYLRQQGFPWSPRLIRGSEGFVANWSRFRVIATEYVSGTPADRAKLDAALCRKIGFIVGEMDRLLSVGEFILSADEGYRSRSTRLMELLPSTASTLSWDIQSEAIQSQWERALIACEEVAKLMGQQVIHTDVWPPNVIVSGGNVVAVLDFDDLAVGPAFLDLAAVVAEFALSPDLRVDERFAYSILRGYFDAAGSLPDVCIRHLIDGIEVACASWLACNALHRVTFAESEVYVHRLETLRDRAHRQSLQATLVDIWREVLGR